MSKEILEQLEFEKNKRKILEQTNMMKKPIVTETENSNKYAWEYELDFYRKSKRKDRFYTFGSICGILALVISLIFHGNEILSFLMQF
ncbi:hypothetical protein QE109_05550 [Fusibacter bizertensis]|jgi:hypothetical protein|uniref:Uncharacterized protein n=1 Tax=Fusibacter bizertensis TaxID=1488331 RepID=A0ABT6NB05_9FIRM|nr:hypothetical protein [Fusibacter bizertensis]MDH8677600.1 hypothetical protein [Fusibacter bizertensis]